MGPDLVLVILCYLAPSLFGSYSHNIVVIFGPCFFNLLVRFVSFCLKSIELQMSIHTEPQFHQSHLDWPKSPSEEPRLAN
jgi:hypothetical protein